MRMQQEDADPLAKVDEEDDSAATKQTLEALTRLEDEGELERFLSFGKWGLTPEDIVRLQKDEEMKQRVSINITNIISNSRDEILPSKKHFSNSIIR